MDQDISGATGPAAAVETTTTGTHADQPGNCQELPPDSPATLATTVPAAAPPPASSAPAAPDDGDADLDLDADLDIEGLDPNLLSAMLAAFQEHPEAKELTKAQQVALCRAADEAGEYTNQVWLSRKINEIRMAAVTGRVTGGFSEITIPEKRQIESLADLEAVLKHHTAWQESVLDPGRAIIGGRANLTDQQLVGYDLSGRDLRGARLSRAVFEGVNFNRTNLATANLAKAKFVGCDLRGAKLKRCDLSYSHFEGCQLAGADFSEATLTGCQFDESSRNSQVGG